MTTIDTQLSAERPHPTLYDLATDALAQVSDILILLFDWQYRARERRQLLGLSDQALKDFAASRADAAGEGDKPSWQA